MTASGSVQPMDPLITAVIPTYRRSRLLKRAVASVLHQTMPRLRVSIFDNASDDETESVARALRHADGRVTYYRHSTNIGAVANFDFGMRQVSTPYFSLLSDDDVLMPTWYLAALEMLERHPEAIFAASRVPVLDESARILSQHASGLRGGVHRPPDGCMDMIENGHPAWTGIVFRRGVFAAAGYLDMAAQLASDIEYELRVAAKCPFVVADEVGACFFVHAGSSLELKSVEQMRTAHEQLVASVKHLRELSTRQRDAAIQTLEERLATSLERQVLIALSRKQVREAREAAALLSAFRPWSGRWLALAVRIGDAATAPTAAVLRAAVTGKRWLARRFASRHSRTDYSDWLSTLVVAD
jgi:hypothetical protein